MCRYLYLNGEPTIYVHYCFWREQSISKIWLDIINSWSKIKLLQIYFMIIDFILQHIFQTQASKKFINEHHYCLSQKKVISVEEPKYLMKNLFVWLFLFVCLNLG